MADEVDKLSLLERVALWYVRARTRALPPPRVDDAVHILDAGEQKALRAIHRGTVFKAALLGALSAGATAAAEAWASPRFLPEGSDPSFENHAAYWGVVLGITVVATAGELSFLYFDAIRSVHRMARAAGLPLFMEDGSPRSHLRSLLRAALEIPPAKDGPSGIDAHRETSRYWLLVLTLGYKLKIGASNFILKTLLRRLLGRTVLKAWVVFAAVPVTAFWNGLVSHLIVREARLRIVGPSAAKRLVDHALSDSISIETYHLLLRVVASCMVRSRAVHPNHVALYRMVNAVGRGLGFTLPEGEPPLGDTSCFLRQLTAAPKEAQQLALLILKTAVAIDGRISGRERALIRDAHLACGIQPDFDGARWLSRAIRSGEEIGPEFLNLEWTALGTG